MGHKAEATNLQNIEFLCFEFLRLVELLSDTVRSIRLHHFLGIYAIFLGNLRPFGGNFTPIYTTWGPGAETPVNPRKLPACICSKIPHLNCVNLGNVSCPNLPEAKFGQNGAWKFYRGAMGKINGGLK